jgi:hypothetical protein
VATARHKHQHLIGQCEQGTQSSGASGHTYHCVAVERGVRRNGKLIASDSQRHIDTIRTMAQQEHLSETCLERMAKAKRMIPTMQATIACVAGYGRQQVGQLDLTPPAS